MTTTHTSGRPDTTDMIVIHRCFRTQFAALPSLVRAVADGDSARAGIVVDFLGELTTALHHHHVGEDEVLWPLLLERADDHARILELEEQHERIGELIDASLAQASAFRTSARPSRGERLADMLTSLSAALNTHLDDEEALALPLAEQHLTVAEWAAVGEVGHASIPKDRMLVFLGYILHSASPEQRAFFLAQSPFAARLAWRFVGKRTFEADYRRVHGRAPTSGAAEGVQ